MYALSARMWRKFVLEVDGRRKWVELGICQFLVLKGDGLSILPISEFLLAC